MGQNIRYVHTNIISNDWRKLADFYIKVFGCIPLYPERNLSGIWVDQLTKIKNSNIKGIHLRLPGYEKDGPTLEIFEYNQKSDDKKPAGINDFGFGHLAFHVDDVKKMIEVVLHENGKKYGETICNHVPGVGLLTAAYVTDPENNIIELQNWKKE
jgi:predicted enzyme related to lactoylglutathione lyase